MNFEVFMERLDNHMKEDSTFQHSIDGRLEGVDQKLEKVLNNHLSHIETDVAVVKTQLSFIMKVMGYAGVAILGIIITAIFKQILL